MRKPAHHAPPVHTAFTTLTATWIRLRDTAFQHCTVRFKMLFGHDEPQLIKTAKGGQVRRGKGSVRQVEVTLMVSVRTSTFGGPRPLSRHQPAQACYTLVREEPVMVRVG